MATVSSDSRNVDLVFLCHLQDYDDTNFAFKLWLKQCAVKVT